MKKSLVLTSLLIATVGLTSCGRKKAQVDPSKTGAIALTAEMTCAAIKAKDKGKLSAATFIDSKKSTEVKENKEASEYAQRVYAKMKKSEDKMEVKLLTPVFKNEDDKIKAFKAKHNIIVAQVGSTDQERVEMFLYKPNAKDTKDGYKAYRAMFAQDNCVPSVTPDEKPMTKEELEAAIKVKDEAIKKQQDLATDEYKKALADANEYIEQNTEALKTKESEMNTAKEKLDELAKGDTASDEYKAAKAAYDKKVAEHATMKKAIDASQKVVDAENSRLAQIKLLETEKAELEKKLKALEGDDSDDDDSDDDSEDDSEEDKK